MSKKKSNQKVQIKAYSTKEVPKIRPTKDSKYSSEHFYRFGNDNLFPQAVQTMLRKSPVLRGGIGSKTTYSLGNGFQTELDALNKYLMSVNANAESLNLVYKKLIKDDWQGGNAYLEVVTTPRTNSLALYHRDWTTARVGKGEYKDHILFLDDWANWHSYQDEIVSIPLYPNFKEIDGSLHSVIHIKDYESGFKRYGVMEWIAGMNAGAIGYMTDEWNVSRLENDMRPSGILTAPVKTQEEADAVQKYYDDNMRGKDNAGKVMVITSEGEGKSAFTPLQDTSEGNWLQLRQSSREDIVTALNWFDVLMGGETKGKLGNSQELRNVWSLAIGNVIKPKQNDYLELFRKLITIHLNLDVKDLTINNTNPIGYGDIVDINALLTKEQALKQLGFDIDEDRTDLTDTITGVNTRDNGESNNTDTSK